MSTNQIKNLALSDTGFLFDPSTGNTYTLNETGLAILRAVQNGKSKKQIIKMICDEYEVSTEQIERDLADMLIQLKELGFEHGL